MSELEEKHRHLEWAIEARRRNQLACLKLLRLLDAEPKFWSSKTASRPAQELLSVAFSLWRAAFLAEKSGKRKSVVGDARTFLARLIEDNAITYPQDKGAREWTFNYYTRAARYSLKFLHGKWSQQVPIYVSATRSPTERWDYCQDLLDQSLTGFEALIQARKDAKLASAARKARKKTVKAQRAIVRKLTQVNEA